MRILLVVATEEEVSPLISEFGISIFRDNLLFNGAQEGFAVSEFFGSAKASKKDPETELFNITSEIEHPKFEISLLITGVGMVATAFSLGRHLVTNKYDLVLNLGIAGSFDRDIALGEVVEITEDTFAELGAEDDNDFLSIDTMGFGEGKFHPSKKLTDLYNLFNTFNLKQATAITVNTVHGNEASIKKVTERLHPQVESMEGAAFFYACKQMDVPCLQIRAVSNYVEKRNRDNWNIGLAIKNLNTFAVEFLKLYA